MTEPSKVLPTWVRWSSGLSGTALLILGSWAVFVTSNGAGTAALITVGLLLTLFGIFGQQIERLRIGDAEVVFRLVDEASKEQNRGNEEAASDLMRTAVSIAEEIRSPGIQEGNVFESDVLALIRQILPENVRVALPARPGLAAFDVLIYSNGQIVGIDVRRGPLMDVRRFLDSIRSVLEADVLGISGILIVIRTPPDDRRVQNLEKVLRQQLGNQLEEAQIRVVGWQSDLDVAELQDALLTLVAG